MNDKPLFEFHGSASFFDMDGTLASRNVAAGKGTRMLLDYEEPECTERLAASHRRSRAVGQRLADFPMMSERIDNSP
jgi:phosphoserine phosphatase